MQKSPLVLLTWFSSGAEYKNILSRKHFICALIFPLIISFLCNGQKAEARSYTSEIVDIVYATEPIEYDFLGNIIGINNEGTVSYVKRDISGNYNLFTCPKNHTPLLFATDSLYSFSGALISNGASPYIVTRGLRSGPNYKIRRYASVDGGYVNVALSPGTYDSLSLFTDVNSSGLVAYSGRIGTMNTISAGFSPDDTIDLGTYTSSARIRPLVSDTNLIVTQDGANRIVTYSYPSAFQNVISDSSYGFLDTGREPGISDDGKGVAFTADSGNGIGVYLVYETENSAPLLINIAQQIVDVDSQTVGSFTDIDFDERIGTQTLSKETLPDGRTRHSVVVVFSGTRINDNDEAVKGIYSGLVTIIEDQPTLSVEGDPSIVVVAKIGEQLWGPDDTLETISSYRLGDPVNPSGDVAFWVGFESGNTGVIISRSSQIWVLSVAIISPDISEATAIRVQNAFKNMNSIKDENVELFTICSSGTHCVVSPTSGFQLLKNKIEEYLEVDESSGELIGKLKEGDTFIVFTHTHGLYEDTGDEVEVEVQIDSGWANPLTGTWAPTQLNTGDEFIPVGISKITDDAFSNIFRGSSNPWNKINKLFIFDFCMSGGFWGTFVENGDPGDLSTIKKAALIAAAEETRYSYGSPFNTRDDGGYLSNALERALNALSTQNSLSFSTLTNEIENQRWFFLDQYVDATTGDFIGVIFGLEENYDTIAPAEFEPTYHRTDDFVFGGVYEKFNSDPYIPNLPNPANGALNVLFQPTLTWSGGDPDSGDTVTYDVYLAANDSTPDLLVCNDVTTTFCGPGAPLQFNTTYYWKVVATDDHSTSSTSSVWSFTTESEQTNNPPNIPASPIPADSATGVLVDATLTWSGGDPDSGDTVTYDVYLAANDSTPDTLVCNATSSTSCDPGANLQYGTQYYWYVRATDNHGSSITSSVWSFTTASQSNTPPNTPSSPSPGDGSGSISVSTNLSWSGGDPDSGDTVTYDVYLAANDSTPDTLVCNATSSTSCDPGANLQYGTQYYWYVRATDNHGSSITSSVWSFTTASQSSTDNIFSDDFDDNSIDSSKWTVIGNRVIETDQMMKVETTAIDAGGSALSQWFTIDPTRPIVVERRVNVHYANNYYTGIFSLSFNDELFITIDYFNYYYYGCAENSFILSDASVALDNLNLISHQTQCSDLSVNGAKTTSIWDTWFDERIIYDPVSGTAEYHIDGIQRAEYDAGPLPLLSSNQAMIYVSAFGWFTGHTQYFDDLRIYQLGSDNPLQGDVNGDQVVDLVDAILGLQCLSGEVSGQPVDLEDVQNADADGDGKLGMAEIIYVLGEL